MNKFEQISNDDQQMSVAGGGRKRYFQVLCLVEERNFGVPGSRSVRVGSVPYGTCDLCHDAWDATYAPRTHL